MEFKAAKESSLGKHFISLKDGEEVIGVFYGNPSTFNQHWVDNKSEPCTGDSSCGPCAEGIRKSFRFRLNLIVSENGRPVAKILEQGRKLYKALSELNNEYPLEDHYVKIKRTGKTMNDTVYTALPLKKEMTSETKRTLSDVRLLPTDPTDPFWMEDQETGFSRPATSSDSEDVPF